MMLRFASTLANSVALATISTLAANPSAANLDNAITTVLSSEATGLRSWASGFRLAFFFSIRFGVSDGSWDELREFR